MGEVTQGPWSTVGDEQPNCYDCALAAVTGGGMLFCTVFKESILDEQSAASDCPYFEGED